jgi:hypothetical protein
MKQSNRRTGRTSFDYSVRSLTRFLLMNILGGQCVMPETIETLAEETGTYYNLPLGVMNVSM